MQISLQEVVPDFIEKEKIAGSQVWGQNLVINKGEHLHIVAPSGSGKTSLIHFIYGLRKDFSGIISYGNTQIKNLSTEGFSSFRQNKISIIFQDLRLFNGMSVRENLEIKRLLDPYHLADTIEDMAERLGIGSRLDKPAKTCSYGEQQRIAIIRSLMQPFDFLLLDEPYSHLDDVNRNKATKLIYEECEKRNAAMVFADLKMLDFLKGEKVVML
ncbi:MAG TPA: ATP-binding cassette domain-containing protein [Chitinophagaceae bacterium]|nr:ATP-binding cassette domain-containing protein [Chitinophagaceae bacterium]